MENLGYPAHVYPNGEGGWIVKFRDIPEAFTEIWSMDELQNICKKEIILVECRLVYSKFKLSEIFLNILICS